MEVAWYQNPSIYPQARNLLANLHLMLDFPFTCLATQVHWTKIGFEIVRPAEYNWLRPNWDESKRVFALRSRCLYPISDERFMFMISFDPLDWSGQIRPLINFDKLISNVFGWGTDNRSAIQLRQTVLKNRLLSASLS